MVKNIIKEIIIVLLLALAIILILGVILYEYVPANKIIPEKASYTTPENVQTELQTDTSIDDTQIVVTYQIDATDLNNYQRIQEYIPGKKNPFAAVQKDDEDEENKTIENSATQTQTNVNSNSNSSTDTNTGYLPDKGTK